MTDRPRSRLHNRSKVVIRPSSHLADAKQLSYNKTFPNSCYGMTKGFTGDLTSASPISTVKIAMVVITAEKTDKFLKMFKL